MGIYWIRFDRSPADEEITQAQQMINYELCWNLPTRYAASDIFEVIRDRNTATNHAYQLRSDVKGIGDSA
jgi:hypothetical protein